MWFVSLLIWLIVIYSLRVSLRGNPEYRLVTTAPESFLDEAATCLDERVEPEDDEIRDFLQKFLHLSLIRMAFFILEIAVAWIILAKDMGQWLMWVIVAKNAVIICFWHFRSRTPENVFSSVKEMSTAVLRWEKLSYLLSACCLLYVFLAINNLV